MELTFPAGTTKLSLFVDPRSTSSVKTEYGSQLDDYDVLLARLHLDQFGLCNRVRLAAGYFHAVYVESFGQNHSVETPVPRAVDLSHA